MNDNNHHSIQDSLVKDSLQANDKLNSQVQQSLTADATINRQFTGTADLPESVPQGQQLTRPASATPNDAIPNDAIPNKSSAQSTSGFDKSAIDNPHTEATDGNEETHFGYKTVKKAEKLDHMTGTLAKTAFTLNA